MSRLNVRSDLSSKQRCREGETGPVVLSQRQVLKMRMQVISFDQDYFVMAEEGVEEVWYGMVVKAASRRLIQWLLRLITKLYRVEAGERLCQMRRYRSVSEYVVRDTTDTIDHKEEDSRRMSG